MPLEESTRTNRAHSAEAVQTGRRRKHNDDGFVAAGTAGVSCEEDAQLRISQSQQHRQQLPQQQHGEEA